MEVIKSLLLICLCSAFTFSARLSSRVEFIVKFVRNCENVDSVIKILNSSTDITDNYDVLSSTCSHFRPYRTAEIHTRLVKNSITVFDGRNNICDRKNRAKEYFGILEAIYGIPPGCPINKEQTFCFNNTKVTSFSRATRRFLPTFFADSKTRFAKTIITHDTGESCFEAGFAME